MPSPPRSPAANLLLLSVEVADEPAEEDSADTITVATPPRAAPKAASGSDENLVPASAAPETAASKRKELASGEAGSKSTPKRIHLTNGKKATKVSCRLSFLQRVLRLMALQSAENAKRTVQSELSINGSSTHPQPPTASNAAQSRSSKPTTSESTKKAAPPTTTADVTASTALQVSSSSDDPLPNAQLKPPNSAEANGAAAVSAPAHSTTDTALSPTRISVPMTNGHPDPQLSSSAAVTGGGQEGAKGSCACGKCLLTSLPPHITAQALTPQAIAQRQSAQQHLVQQQRTKQFLGEVEIINAKRLAQASAAQRAQPTALSSLEPFMNAEQTILAGLQHFRQAALALSAEKPDLHSQVDRLRHEVKNVETLRASNNRMSSQITTTIPDLESKIKKLNEENDRLQSHAAGLEKAHQAEHKECYAAEVL